MTKDSFAYRCNIRQKQKNTFALRLRAVGGDLTAHQLRTIADVADQYGQGRIHITSRQGVEIHHVSGDETDHAQRALEEAGIQMGADGNRVRIIIACPGKATCRYGSIDTRAMAEELDKRYFRADIPYKLKIGVTGCPNNCGKAREADIGIMGVRTPKWTKDNCTGCNACIKLCAVEAIHEEENNYIRDEKKCIGCSACTARCPTGAWQATSFGYSVLIGGTLGKRPRLAIPLTEPVATQEEAIDLVDRTIRYYRENGKPRERLGHMLDRLGEQTTKDNILQNNP